MDVVPLVAVLVASLSIWIAAGFFNEFLILLGALSGTLVFLALLARLLLRIRAPLWNTIGAMVAVASLACVPLAAKAGFRLYGERVRAQIGVYEAAVSRVSGELKVPGTLPLRRENALPWGALHAERTNDELIVWFHSGWGRRGVIYFSGGDLGTSTLRGSVEVRQIEPHWYTF